MKKLWNIVTVKTAVLVLCYCDVLLARCTSLKRLQRITEAEILYFRQESILVIHI